MVSFTQDSEFIFLFDNAVVIATKKKIVFRSQDMWIYVFFSMVAPSSITKDLRQSLSAQKSNEERIANIYLKLN